MAASTTDQPNKVPIEDIINDIDTKHYFIQIPRGSLTTHFNHITHGAIALYRLGASREQLNAYLKWYSEGLHKPVKDSPTIPARSMATEETDVWKLVGQREGYYNLLDYYKGLLAEHGGSLDKLLHDEFPKLMAGLAGGALHGVIHIGYGYTVKSDQLVCEGLAFLHYANVPIKFTENAVAVQRLGHEGEIDVLDIIAEIRNNSELREFWRRRFREELVMHRKTKPWPPSGFQVKVAPLLNEKADLLADYVNRIKIPQFQYNVEDSTEKQMKILVKWVMDSIITLFLAVENRNSFFLLHGITGSWGLSQFLGTLTDYHTSVQCVRTLLCVVLAVYIEEDCPKVDPKFLEDIDVSDVTWDDVLSRLYRLPADTDEHIYKLVHVCHYMSQNNNDPNMYDTYKRAAIMSMTHPLSFPEPIDPEE